MPVRVTFDLDEKDLRYFRGNMKQAQAAAAKLGEAEVIAGAEEMVLELKKAKVPMFVAVRLAKLRSLLDMVKDDEWQLSGNERKNVLSALAYFADPHDMIPDSIPVLGFIDDAIMIELLTGELRPEIDAYNDFCRYRDEMRSGKAGGNVTRQQFLDSKRNALHSRMRRRRTRASSAPRGTRTTMF
ncbi:MAG TPA: YkvA family protein [Pseudomonadales bacterium]